MLGRTDPCVKVGQTAVMHHILGDKSMPSCVTLMNLVNAKEMKGKKGNSNSLFNVA